MTSQRQKIKQILSEAGFWIRVAQDEDTFAEKMEHGMQPEYRSGFRDNAEQSRTKAYTKLQMLDVYLSG